MSRAPLTVLAPLDGEVVALADVADPVFAGAMVGPGVAIDPSPAPGGATARVAAGAPVSGVVVKLLPHACVVAVADGRAVLVHLGLDTVELAGAGFTVHVAQGDVVVAGGPMIVWDPAAVAAGGRATVCPVVALDAAPGAVTLLAAPGARVRAGDPLLRWD